LLGSSRSVSLNRICGAEIGSIVLLSGGKAAIDGDNLQVCRSEIRWQGLYGLELAQKKVEDPRNTPKRLFLDLLRNPNMAIQEICARTRVPNLSKVGNHKTAGKTLPD